MIRVCEQSLIIQGIVQRVKMYMEPISLDQLEISSTKRDNFDFLIQKISD